MKKYLIFLLITSIAFSVMYSKGGSGGGGNSGNSSGSSGNSSGQNNNNEKKSQSDKQNKNSDSKKYEYQKLYEYNYRYEKTVRVEGRIKEINKGENYEIRVAMNNRERIILLGPVDYIDNSEVKMKVGDTIKLNCFEAAENKYAYQVKNMYLNKKTIELRDKNGKPLWEE